MTTVGRAFVGLGSNAPDAPSRLAAAVAALHEAGERIAAVARTVRSPYEVADGSVDPAAPEVLNSVAEILTARSPRALLDLLRAIEADAQRDRSTARERSLDLDLLMHGDRRTKEGGEEGVHLPHPRALARAFVLAPWEEIAPLVRVPGTDRAVTAHAATLRAQHPERFHRLRPEALVPLPGAGGSCEILDTAVALAAWRDGATGSVGVVPTMGALHAGHESLIRRAAAECDHVVGHALRESAPIRPRRGSGALPAHVRRGSGGPRPRRGRGGVRAGPRAISSLRPSRRS